MDAFTKPTFTHAVMTMEPRPEGGVAPKRRREQRQRLSLWERVLQRAPRPSWRGQARDSPWGCSQWSGTWERATRGPHGASTHFCCHPLRPGLRPRGQRCVTAVCGRWRAGPAHCDPLITHEACRQQRPPVSPRAPSRSAEEADVRPRARTEGWPLTPDTAPVLKDSVPLPCQAPPSGLVRKASGG